MGHQRVKSSQSKCEEKQRNLKTCGYCSQKHIFGSNNCSALGKRCGYCGKINHVEKACFNKNSRLCRYRRNEFLTNSKCKRRSSSLQESKNSVPPACEVGTQRFEKSKEQIRERD